MASRFSIGPIHLSVKPHEHQVARERTEGEPFKILLMADFSGTTEGLFPARPLRVDSDNIDAILARFATHVEIQAGGERIVLEPRALADLHPDQLFQHATFAPLRDLRTRLAHPRTFAAAAAELNALTGAGQVVSQATPAAGVQSRESDEDVLQRLLGKSPAAAKPAAPARSVVEGLLREAVAPSLATANAKDQQSAIAALDAVISSKMRRVLHAPEFQAIEAAWRGLEFLTHRLELVLLDVVNVSPAGLTTLATGGFSTLTAEGRRWDAIVVNSQFRGTADDAAVAQALGELGTRCGAAVLGGFETKEDALQNVGAAFVTEWNAMRSQSSASHLSLAAPRFMLRRPYGKTTDAIESFQFEEITGRPHATDYLWGNSALLNVCLLALCFQEYGWEMSGREIDRIEGLPIHTFREDGEAQMTRPVEFWVSDSSSEQLMLAGISPVQPVLGSDAAVTRLVSVAGTALAVGQAG